MENDDLFVLEPELSKSKVERINGNSKYCKALPFTDISQDNDVTEISDVRDFVMSFFEERLDAEQSSELQIVTI